ncbi:cation transporter [Haloferax mediterranei ATCC 33500]|uniref:Cation transporter n=1 Tax=Haloferax mediterranei (strain ATCC 33500 / DSM 1411 / JCM 8866 / NBRC 14739 / NCIMB 2177 / R-4) TaxID=523841 RepID=I3R7T8_HALMT|nr:cation diffusion facilitator family transporter [Haloferax mediterranei]AFK20298.2 cation transporter (substrates zinc/cadmium) [Haloferax mediterranei ATCC 33500]AHZ23667.1 cation transporter [Haloferax mediterranei ATCC 33500]ELZ99154.1 cation transporter (substrates zinc/cadmium) [Haloferax mediterranei ATCC 33500]MDX5986947.1 cation diffusion facilitator family transporter [Haloferax mediterranei ATCC 33500]QCQ76266.1 cation transporter [Haloferax mediterranei ATCC 33500]
MERKRAIRRVGLVVLVANVLLVLGKGSVWWTTGSLALGSEAVNSLADTVYSAIIVGGLYLTTKPPDFEHPHGHERIEPFVSLFVAVGIFAAGGAILWQSTSSILTETYGGTAGVLGAAVLVAAALFKYFLYRYCYTVGREQNSPALVAAGLDNRNDILTAGAALVGVAGAQFGYPILDPLAAMVVSIGIIYTGYEIVRDNVNYLVGAAPPEYLRDLIVQTALSHPDVYGAHDVVAHYVGPEVDVSLHIEVEGDMTITEAHDIETWVVEAIGEIDEVDDVFVHVDPKELGEWKDGTDTDRYTIFSPDGGDE